MRKQNSNSKKETNKQTAIRKGKQTKRPATKDQTTTKRKNDKQVKNKKTNSNTITDIINNFNLSDLSNNFDNADDEDTSLSLRSSLNYSSLFVPNVPKIIN